MKYAPDATLCIGISLAARGLWLIYPPAAMIVVGAVLVVISRSMVMEAKR